MIEVIRRAARGRGALRRRRFAPIAFLLGAFLAWAPPVPIATAHAELDRSNPTAGGVIPAAPAAVEVWFTEEVDAELTTLRVTGPDGTPADLGDAAVDLNDLSRRRATVSLKPGSGPGTYTVAWHAVSPADQAVSEGSFAFTVTGGSPGTPPGTPCPLPGTAVVDGTPGAVGTPAFGTPSPDAGTPAARPGPVGTC